MVYEGTLREAQFSNGQLKDLNVYSMLKDEYITLKKNEK